MGRVTVTGGGVTATADYTLTTTTDRFTPVWGVDIAMNDGSGRSLKQHYDEFVKTFGGPLGGRLKYFDGNKGVDAAIQNMVAVAGTEPFPNICYKSATDAALIARLDKITKPEVWTPWQEPNNDIASGALTVPKYNALLAQAMRIKKAHPKGDLIQVVSNLQGSWERNPATSIWNQVDLNSIDAGAFDMYSPDTRAKIFTPQEMFGPLFDWLAAGKKVNPNFKVYGAEYGVARYLNATNLVPATVRLQAIKDHVTYAKANGISGINYWNIDNSAGNSDWRIDQPGDEAILAYWTSLITR